MELPSNLRAAFERYLDNRYSSEDFRLIQDHFNKDADRNNLYQLIEEELQRDASLDQDKRIDRIIENTDALLFAYVRETKPPTKHVYRKLYYLVGTAAAIAMLYFGIGFWNNRPAKLITATAVYGETKQVTLPDNTVVWLNAGTTIEYPERFKTKERQVTLKDGEAFFDVSHDPKHPFKVTSQKLTVSVLGTSFVFKSFESDHTVSVAVRTGKVGVSPENHSVAMLLPGQQVVLDKQSNELTTRTIGVDDIASWRENKMVFEKENFEDVVRALERKYNVQIKVGNPQLLKQKITLRLNNQPLEQVLSVMAFSNNFKYTINGRIVMVN